MLAWLLVLAIITVYAHECANSLHRTTWRNDIGANVTFFAHGGALSGYYSPGIVSNLQTIKHYPIVGYILQQCTDPSTARDIIAWVVSWETDDGITSFTGHIYGRVIYVNATLILPLNFTSTSDGTYNQVL
jgi:hypothetical protein